MKTVGRHAVAAAIAAIALTGCGSRIVEGEATTLTPEEGEPLFDPCSIPDDILHHIGVDPATERRDILDVKQPEWSICGWNDADVTFFVTIFATGKPLETILTHDKFYDVTPIDFAGRRAFTLREKSDTRNEHCDIVLASGPDTLMLQTSNAKGLPPGESPCPRAIHNALMLEPVLPH